MKLTIEFDEVTESEFSANIEFADGRSFWVEGENDTDEMENLYGDQVESISTLARFDSLSDVKPYDQDGESCNSISLSEIETIKKALDSGLRDYEISAQKYKVDYSPRYYDLI
jgi:hypothetical protein